MMTKIATDFASKLAVAFVAVAMVFAAFAPAAQAQSSEDLQQMINDLLAQVAQLQGQTTGGGDSVMNCSSFLSDLAQGTSNGEVMRLQQFLNMDQDTRVAAAGSVGSAGMETQYYGPATAAAVSKFQVKYRAEILSPLGLVNPTGYWGAGSRAKANALCSETVVTTPDTDEDATDEDDEDMDEEDDEVALGGYATLETMEIDGAQDDEIEEGKDDQEVAELTVEFENGDASVSRLDIKFDKSGANAEDAFETISLWVDGDMVAEKDADDEDDYLSDEKTMRFSGLDIIAMEDEELEIIVAVSTQDNLDTAEKGTWNVSVESMRYFDADGVALTENSGEDFGVTESFSIEEAGYEDEVLVKTSSNDPDSATLQVEDSSRSDWYNVFTFDLDTDDSINDIEFNRIDLEVLVSSSTYSALVDDAEIVFDGQTIDDVTVTGGTSATATLSFDVDGDVVVDAGDRVEVELMLRFKSLKAGDEGVTVQGRILSASTANIDAEGVDDIENTNLSGSATGDAHTLRTSGVDVSKESTSATKTSVDGPNNDTATFEIEVEVTAFEQDVYIDVDPATSIGYSLVDGSSNTATTGSQIVVLTSSADEQGSYFEISEGQSETITLQVTYTPGTGASARLRMDSISFAETAVAPTQTQTTLPKTNYRTGIITITD